MYDPWLGRMLSPDNFVQAPDYTQNLNRYSYALNNPLRYTDPDGEYIPIFVVPNVSCSAEGGFSLGIMVGIGLPGGLSAQIGVGYNFTNDDPYAFISGSFMFNSVYLSYASSSGFNTGYTAGLTLYSGFPVSTNFLTVGVNYNITHNSWSGNLSAWSIDHNGWSFNPSFSAMIFPEETTNFLRSGKFYNNDQMLNYFTDKGEYQKALEYFGFEGEYSEKYGNDGWYDTKTNEIYYSEGAFTSFDDLLQTNLKETYEKKRFNKGKWTQPDKPTGMFSYDKEPEEYSGHKYLYRQKGLFSSSKIDEIKTIQSVEGNLTRYNGYFPGFYSFTAFHTRWWHFIYKIPRKW